MGTRFSELWKDPQFINPAMKEKVNNQVELIGKIIEERESKINSQKDIDIGSIDAPKSNTK